MTRTATWLEERRRDLARRVSLAAALLGLGGMLAALGVGIIIVRTGAHRTFSPLVLVGWLAAAGAIVLAFYWGRSAVSQITRGFLADSIETTSSLRRGSVKVLSSDESALRDSALGMLADEKTYGWLEGNGMQGLAPVAARTSGTLKKSGTAFAAGAVLFFMSAPVSGGARPFWNPIRTTVGPTGPIVITVDRNEVPRGQSVRLEIDASGRARIQLWTREPGSVWSSETITLDSLGRGAITLGPLENDRYVAASAGSRSSDTLHIGVSLPTLLAEFSLIARYPSYLNRIDEPLDTGDTLYLPVGTRVVTSGRMTVPVASAQWRDAADASRTSDLESDGDRFSGELRINRSASWVLDVDGEAGAPLDQRAPVLAVVAVPDSAPVVAVPVPGADTIAPVSLIQPLVVDVRDDNLVTGVELLSRVSGSDQRTTVAIPLPRGGADRAVLQWQLDMNDRNLQPGDTLFYAVRAFDNSPAAQVTVTDEFMLRIPSRREQRSDLRDRLDEIAARVDSLARAQRDLEERSENLAQEQQRNQDSEQMSFQSAEQARDLAQEQESTISDAEDLRESVSELADMAREAGMNDSDFQEQLREIQELLDQALSEDLRERLNRLQQALDRLDSRNAEDALRQLAEAQRQMREDLERSRDLFERAALEGEMSTLAEDAEELAELQAEWAEAAERGDSGAADAGQALAQTTDSLVQDLAQLQQAMDMMNEAQDMSGAMDQAQQSAEQMQNAAQQSQMGNNQQAGQQGQEAAANMANLPEELREQRDQMREQWRREVIDLLDRALIETADLARRQERVVTELEEGNTSSDVRSEQASLRDGVERIVQRLQEASGMNALISPRLATGMGFTREKMTAALNHLQQGSPNVRGAAEQSGDALDGLNDLAHALLRGKDDVSGSESGSGLEEAMERLQQAAQSQSSLNAQTSEMMPMMRRGGSQLIQQLQQLADQQQRLAEELERIDAESEVSGVDNLAEEARDLAQRIEAGRLDRQTIERQQQLFRRLLDSGRTLNSGEEDENKERQSEEPEDVEVRVPDELSPDALRGPRFAYPEWADLSRLTPEDRRLILEYFRRLNEQEN